ncbi:MAG: NTP transferase domain-containing protein [Actinobacteria bacterium]|nr:NTP transferase domain-containing protein [Actinomycetota bacterium]
MLDNLPAFGICGKPGSGRTTLIKAILPRLRAQGLDVAVAAHDPKNTGTEKLCSLLSSLSQQNDLMLVEGCRSTPLPQVWLLNDDQQEDSNQGRIALAALSRESDRVNTLLAILEEWLSCQWLKTPVFGCVLIGGKSTRLGKPKHLLERNGKTWLEHTVELLRQVTDRTVIAGVGMLPEKLRDCVRLYDAPKIDGPMAGVLSAMRWARRASWLVTACDLPGLSVEALRWLLTTRRPGIWATLPKLQNKVNAEPLLAHYDFRSRTLLEELARQRKFSLNLLAAGSKVLSTAPPAELSPAWLNINTPQQLQSYLDTTGPDVK